MTFSQYHLELMSKDAYVNGGRDSGRSKPDSQGNSGAQQEKTEKKYGLITKRDR